VIRAIVYGLAAMVLVLMALAVVLDCDGGSQRHPSSLHVVERHCCDGEPTVAVLDCERGHRLVSELGNYSAKIWCVPIDAKDASFSPCSGAER
jgi:hypothetical protein